MVDSNDEIKVVHLDLPAKDDDIARLELGSAVYLSGVVYTAREGVYKKVLEDGAALPIDLPAVSNVNFHCSPAAAADGSGGYNVGAVTATASFRFSKWMPGWLARTGCRIVIGKVHWLDELGIAQAMWVFEVENFGPFLVESDLAGNSLFARHAEQINAGIEKLYAGLKPPALHRYGESDDRKSELM